MPNIQNLSTTN